MLNLVSKSSVNRIVLGILALENVESIVNMSYLLKYNNFNIINYNIKANVVIRKGALKYSITGKSGNQYVLKNLLDRYFNKEYITIIKKIDKYIQNITDKKTMIINSDNVIIAQSKNDKCKCIELTRQELVSLYNEIIRKYSSSVYSYSVINSIVENAKLIDFMSFNVQDMIIIVSELLNLLQTNSRKVANLKLMNLSSNSGTIYGAKKLSSGMKFIAESITGYYTKVIFEVSE